MPIRQNQSGVGTRVTPRVLVDGQATECNVWLNENGEAIPIHLVEEIIDDFERGNLDPYGSDDWDTFTLLDVGDFAVKGRHVVRFEPDTPGTDMIYSPVGNGLRNYPVRGDKFRWFTYRENNIGNNRARTSFGGQKTTTDDIDVVNDPNYWAGVWENKIRLSRWENGSIQNMEEVFLTPPTSQWMRIDVDWDSAGDGNIHMSMYSESGTLQGSITMQDTTWDDGGFGWIAGHELNNPQFVDYAHLI